MTKQLSAEEISIFKDCFNEYDTDKGGNITVEEFARVMRKTNPTVSDEEVSKIISEVDLDGDGTINFDEFITMMTGQPYKSPEPAAAAGESTGTDGTQASIVGSVAAFRGVSNVSALLKRQRETNRVFKDAWLEIDPSLKGSITPSELEHVASKAGLVVTADDVQGMIDPANGEGKITCEHPFMSLFCDMTHLLTSGSLGADDKFLEFVKRQEVDDIVSGYE
ncbi:hypothetical protein Daus18300_013082 [Diaporthe australafricana]|uniref:EF-hand domain-containing protein n=1 Tax=Diaporthe australafricana TaxID=127596 RepID=A0ABR3W0C3_9PEZI